MTVTNQLSSQQGKTGVTLLWLTVGWHVLISLAGLAGAALLWGAAVPPEDPAWLRPLQLVLLLLHAAGNVAAVVFLLRRQHTGRVLSLVVNYLAFVVCLVAALHLLKVFIGIDALADTFGRALPYLGLVLAGYLVYVFGDRYESRPARQKLFQQAGNIIMAVFAVVFLLVAGLAQGLLALVSGLQNPVTLGLLVAAILFLVMLLIVWRDPVAALLRAKHTHEEMLSGFLFLSPNFLGFLFFFAGPLVLSLYTSFTDWDAFGTKNWVGLANYAKILNLTVRPLSAPDQPVQDVMDMKVYDELTRLPLGGGGVVVGAEDKLFWISLGNTLLFGVLAVPLSVIGAMLLSNVLNSKLPGMKFYRVIYFLPSIAAVVGIALVWQWLYNASVGYINYFITLGVNFANNVLHLGLVDPRIRWLSESRTAMLAIVILFAWQTMGFNTVLFLAGLQNIPGELYEAATVDGAGAWQRFVSITLPMLAPTTFYVVSTTSIQALQLFEQVFIMTNPVGGPNNSTLSVVVYLYQNGFQRFKQGYASAIAWVLFIVIFIITMLQYRRQQKSNIYG
jgi:ABC-type sugar transport system permease subunit